ncbi:Uncharacterised protein [Suttonella ornithocola]|uniref:Uncharacterized protein n=1 Tax=Suttonella ornithocola TaxID=279832 RepID=A0A380MYB5_9GAMM|nr:Uncharacterised protein [Suttonella ornithocola]
MNHYPKEKEGHNNFTIIMLPTFRDKPFTWLWYKFKQLDESYENHNIFVAFFGLSNILVHIL